ncbi:MAG: UvrD-helicase domain-containing protein [Bacteroidales bacterium]|nr:UvrD-helicase domain-containing protein [Bacteroidales bacterium]
MLRIYKASAGSGKTYTLAKDYIRLLLGYKDEGKETYRLNLAPDGSRLRFENRHRAILAITFTRKATEEMKSRIISELDKLADPEGDSPYAAEMQQELRCSRKQLAQTAAMALSQILFDYGNFQVSTIDAFFQRVLHTFARELDRQSDYNIELDDRAAMKAAVGSMLDQFNASPTEDSELEKWLFQYINELISEGKKANILNRRSQGHTDLVKEVSYISQESFKPFANDMREYLESGRLEAYASAIKERKRSLMSSLQTMAQSLLEGIDLSCCTTVIARVAQSAIEGKKVTKRDLETKTVVKLIEDPDAWAFVKKTKYGTEAQSQAIRQVLTRVRDTYASIISIAPIEESLVQLGFLAHAWGYLVRFTEENNTLLISDTNQLVHRIIGKDEAPFIYERMGVQLGHFLIDEFQDTSRMQWENLRPLVGNGLARGLDSLVIGDEKQSIYRFRNSDSSILHSQVQRDFDDFIDPASSTAQRSTNYRSAAPVVRFNNTVFSLLAPMMEVEGFENVVQQVRDEYVDRPGYVRFTPYPPKKGTDEEGKTVSLNKEVLSEWALEQMAQEILRQLRSGYQGKDIAVLTYTNREAARVVDYLLRNHFQDIKVLSDEAMKITASTAVQLIISMLKIIDQEHANTLPTPEETKGEKPKYMSRAQVAVAINRFEYLLTKREAEEGGNEDNLPMQALRQALDSDGTDAMTQGIRAIKAMKPSSLPALVEAIIGTQISEDERRNQFAFLAAFQDLVIDYSGHTDGSLHSFLDWWEASGKNHTITGATDPDAVRVMTIHKSKGLEFHCVHLPFCWWSHHFNQTPKVWMATPPVAGINSELAPPAIYVTLDATAANVDSPLHDAYLEEWQSSAVDNLNKTYVAFTRAQSELIAWYDGENTNSIGHLLSQAFSQRISDPEGQQLIDEGLAVDLTEHFDPATWVFTLGEPTVKTQTKEEETTAQADEQPLEEYPVNFRTDRTRDIISVDDIFELDRDIDDASAPAAEPVQKPHIPNPMLRQEEEEARYEGLILHDIMARIYTRIDLGRAVATAAARNHLPLHLMKAYRRTVERFLDCGDERVARWYGSYANVYIEQPIYIPNMNYIRRPDRIVINHDGSVDVIDYKFTEHDTHSGTPEQQRQVREYMSLMRDMGYKTVRGYLVYPRLSKILQV